MVCILTDYKRDSCASCSNICPHKVFLHGMDGLGGAVMEAGVPRDYMHVTFDNSPARNGNDVVYRKLTKYVESFKRHVDGGDPAKSVYLYSNNTGTGKTTTAVALLNAWIATEYLSALKAGRQPKRNSAKFLDINELQTRYNLATMIKEESGLRSVQSDIVATQYADFAVIDDIGVRDATDAFRAYVHSIINHRTTNRMPTVYTSNIMIEDIAKVFDARLYDRVRDQCAVMTFDGESHRGMRRN